MQNITQFQDTKIYINRLLNITDSLVLSFGFLLLLVSMPWTCIELKTITGFPDFNIRIIVNYLYLIGRFSLKFQNLSVRISSNI